MNVRTALTEVRDQAAAWYKRLGECSGGMDAGESHAFHEWLASPVNKRALREFDELVSRIHELTDDQRERLRQRFEYPPGRILVRLAGRLLPQPAFNRYVAPTIADMQYEYSEADEAGRKWHARWIVARGHLLVIPGCVYAFVGARLRELLRRGR